jgi:hypothetical protein
VDGFVFMTFELCFLLSFVAVISLLQSALLSAANLAGARQHSTPEGKRPFSSRMKVLKPAESK